jgi:hypothetical protein
MDTKTRRAEKKLRACKSCVPRNAVRKARVLAKRARALGKAEVDKAAE